MRLIFPSGTARSIATLMPYSTSMKATAIKGFKNMASNQFITPFYAKAQKCQP